MKKTIATEERKYAAPEIEEITMVSSNVMQASDPENPEIPDPDE